MAAPLLWPRAYRVVGWIDVLTAGLSSLMLDGLLRLLLLHWNHADTKNAENNESTELRLAYSRPSEPESVHSGEVPPSSVERSTGIIALLH